MKKDVFFRLFYGVFFISLCAFTFFSFSLTAPNLIITSWAPYWQFQNFMWHTFFNNRQSLILFFAIIISLLQAAYLGLVLASRQLHLSIKSIGLLLFLCCAPLLLSMNALSYDLFNYIFNAKMVIEYRVNPHQSVALDFAQDDWTKFMHNTHTTAPYGYGWTVLSLIPYGLGFTKLLLTLLSFKLFSLLSLFFTYFAAIWVIKQWQGKHSHFWLLAIFLNPLVLIEVLSSAHNDLWMIVPALISFGLLAQKKIPWPTILFSAFLLLLSISIKFATLVLLPIWFLTLIKNRFSQTWPLWCSLALFVPLLTSRSQQFHPWYLTWSLLFVPLVYSFRHHIIKALPSPLTTYFLSWWGRSLLVLSASSLWRYYPVLRDGGFIENTFLTQKMITWLPFLGFTILFIIGTVIQSTIKKYSS